MVSAEVIQKMKQTNISSDAGKTKQRVKELWKSANNEDKLKIEDLAGVKRTTIARVYKTGNISAKLVTPIAQTLNVDPLYIIGQSNAKGECTEKTLNSFLKKFTSKPTSAPKPVKEEKPAKENKAAIPAAASSNVIDTLLSDDDVILLVRSLLIKSRAGGKHAETMNKLKEILFL